MHPCLTLILACSIRRAECLLSSCFLTPFHAPCQGPLRKTMKQRMRENDSAGTLAADGCAYLSLDSMPTGPPHTSLLDLKVDDSPWEELRNSRVVLIPPYAQLDEREEVPGGRTQYMLSQYPLRACAGESDEGQCAQWAGTRRLSWWHYRPGRSLSPPRMGNRYRSQDNCCPSHLLSPIIVPRPRRLNIAWPT